tara:strand:- start:9151 stop:10203 length:1053 start_codon:yes stop_codon:yes gene_type:complete
MNIYKLSILIIVILIKTGNVLSNESIFTVNNIEINKNSFKNNDELIELAFKAGFQKLNNKILLEKDIVKLKDISLKNIKNLVSHYQIVKKKNENNKDLILVNVFFKRNNMYDFYSKKNVRYSDVRGKNIKILPILLVKKETLIYENNFFYKNWINETSKSNKKNEIIEYILPLENIEVIEQIKKNQDNLESIQLNKIFDENVEKDNLLIIINYNAKLSKIFLTGSISTKKITKNLSFSKNSEEEITYPELMVFLKKQIKEIVKSQNVIDINTPTFLNIKLELKNKNDLFIFQEILNRIDLIDNFNVSEFNNKSAYIKIKYYGKTNIIKEKLSNQGMQLSLDNNELSARLK